MIAAISSADVSMDGAAYRKSTPVAAKSNITNTKKFIYSSTDSTAGTRSHRLLMPSFSSMMPSSGAVVGVYLHIVVGQVAAVGLG